MKTLKLKNPITVNGKQVAELTYDSNEITGVGFVEAEAKRKASAGIKNTSLTLAPEFDFGLHLYLGFAAVIAVNPQIDFDDMERVKGSDVRALMSIGRDFILESEELQENNSDEQSETTDDTITQA